VIWLVLLPTLASAGEASPKAKKESGERSGISLKEPIHITADRMEVDRKKNTITYRGNVVTTQGDMTMRSETLAAVYDPDLKGLQTVVAEGKVQLAQSGRTATGSKAVFNGQEQTITLTGDPVIHHGNSQISGTRIVFFIEEDRATVEGGKERVKATVFPEDFGDKKERETKQPKGS
jgi:lipopolysaccharide export system protein LptA